MWSLHQCTCLFTCSVIILETHSIHMSVGKCVHTCTYVYMYVCAYVCVYFGSAKGFILFAWTNVMYVHFMCCAVHEYTHFVL